MRILSTDPVSHETTHGQTRDGPVFPVSNSIIMTIDKTNEFGIINWKLPVGFCRPNIIGSKVIFFICTPVVPVGLYYNDIMCRNKFFDIVSFIVIALVKLFILMSAISKKTL